MKRILSLCLCACLLLAAAPMTAFAAGKGDVNNDGALNTMDARTMLRGLLKGESFTQQEIWWGDYTVDDAIDTADARLLLKKVLGGEVVQAVNYANPTGENYWGERAITLLGDSISFGVGASDPLPETTYVSYVKKAVQAANGGNLNYGFTSAYAGHWQPNNFAFELHSWPTQSTFSDGTSHWNCDNIDKGTRLMSVAMISSTPWSTVTYTLREQYADEYDYFCVYYHVEPNAGGFVVADGKEGEVADVNGSKAIIQTASADSSEYTTRTAFYRLSDCPKDENGLPKIILCHDGSSAPVSITGIGYYKDITENGITFNSFTRGGLSLIKTSDKVLEQVAKSDTLIFALGYNDTASFSSQVLAGEFTAKINYLIDLCKANGTQVIVNDVTWHQEFDAAGTILQAQTLVRSELRRFARETGGIYINQPALLGQSILDDLNTKGDGIHPSSDGMRLVAQNVVSAMGLTWTEEWT